MTRLLTFGETLGLVATPVGVLLPHAPHATLGIGGAESNVAIGVRRLGSRATWAGRIGGDSFGELVLKRLRGEDIDVVAVEDSSASTALMIKERRSPSRARVTYYRSHSAGSRLEPSDLDAAFTDDVSVVHVTGITPGLSASAAATVEAALGIAGRNGVFVSFDVNHRSAVWRGRDAAPTYRTIAARADLVFAGIDEAQLLLGSSSSSPQRLLRELSEVVRGDIVLKLGPDGCAARIDGRDWWQPAMPVTVVDTVGAGDAFVAGYLADYLTGAPPDQRLLTAVRCGAMMCASLGDWEGGPTRDDLDDFDLDEPVMR